MLAFPRGGENIVRVTNAPMPSECTRGPGNFSMSIYTKSRGARLFSFWSCITTPLKEKGLKVSYINFVSVHII